MIPARIISTYRSRHALPPVFADCQKRMLKLHPDWKHDFFSDYTAREFVRKRRADLIELYDFYPRPVMRADLFRVVAVHELGGFYLDLDVHLFEPIDELRRATLVLPEEWEMTPEQYRGRHKCEPGDARDLCQVGNYAFGAERKHWFLEEVIEEMIRRAEAINPSGSTNEDVLYATGPDVFHAVFRQRRVDRCPGLLLLQGRADPPEPKPRFMGEEGRWSQFGRFGNHLMSGVWRMSE